MIARRSEMIRRLLRSLKRFGARHTGILRMYHEHLTLLAGQAEIKQQLATLPAQFQQQARLTHELVMGLLGRLEHHATISHELAGAEGSRFDQHSNILSGLAEVTTRSFDQQTHLLSALTDLKQELAENTKEIRQSLAEVTNEEATRRDTLAQELTGLREQLAGVARLASQQACIPADLADLKSQMGQIQLWVNQLGPISDLADLKRQVAGITTLFEQFTAIHGGLQEIKQRLQRLEGQVQKNLPEKLGEINERVYRIASQVPDIASWQLDKHKVREYEGLLRYLRKKHYEEAIETNHLEVPELETYYPLALDTDDSRFPWGAKNDNSISLQFNQKMYQLLGTEKRLRVLDLGCAGGGFVRSLLDDGHLAVGLEGSSYPKTTQSGEWGTIPHHLHTCDITKPFSLRDPSTGEICQFDAITAWEVMEHIREQDLPELFANINKHLAADGHILFSVSTIEDKNEEVGAVYHLTVRPKDWWQARLSELGFEPVNQMVIGKNDWLRGSGQCRYDRNVEDEGTGFHVVLRRKSSAALAA
jgi:2-polyprenyl-3-methyl-5-hydroxy-6-metoxy-1,4-benzoquinol methylase